MLPSPARRAARERQPAPGREPRRDHPDLRDPALDRAELQAGQGTSWAGPTSRSAPMSPSAATRCWSTARSASAGTPGFTISRRSKTTRHRSRNPAAERGGPAAAAPPPPAPSWPRALRAVRAWLSPWTVLQRWWQAWSKAPPPPQLQALIDSVAAGCGLHLYIPN